MFASLNLVTPDEEAANISPLFVWLTIKEAFPPIPPEIERGAGVLADEPISTPELKSDERTILPDPLGVRVILLLLPFVIVLPDTDRLFVPKSRVPTLEILFPAALICPPRVKALIVKVLVDERTGAVPVNCIELSASCVTFDPESITMFPVLPPPIVSVWALVVPRLPKPVR